LLTFKCDGIIDLYGQACMRRLFSIPVILMLWLGPLAAVLPGTDESQLPFCCRRHGVHHCAMDSDPTQNAGLAFKSPSRCTQFPATLAVPTSPALGLAASLTPSFVLAVSKYVPGASRDDARAGQIRAGADRGPPPNTAIA
jgi:hypothetical protein